jgi:hypothetical protein
MRLTFFYLPMNWQRCTTCYYHLLHSTAIISGILGTVVPIVVGLKTAGMRRARLQSGLKGMLRQCLATYANSLKRAGTVH